MKKFKFLSLWALALAIGFAGCNNDDDGPDEIIEDGYYVVGEAAASNAIVANGKMSNGINEAGQIELSGLYDKYVALEAGKTFKIMKKAGVVETSYGGELAVDTLKGEEDQIGGGEGNQVAIQKGALVENGAGFEVPENGLYQVVIYEATTGTNVFVIPVEWQFNGIGQTAEDGGGYKLTPSAFNKTSMTFTLDKVTAELGNWKFKNHDGWKVKIAEGVFINCNLGLVKDGNFKYDGSQNSLLPGGGDIPVGLTTRAVYTVTLTWTLGTGWSHTAKFEKTGSLEPIDPAAIVYSLIGNAFNNEEGLPANWDYDLDFTYDAANSTATVSKYNLANASLLAGGEFKIRKDHAWLTSFGYDANKIKGDAANFEDAGGNIKVKAAKTYTSVVFVYDWDKSDWEVTFTE